MKGFSSLFFGDVLFKRLEDRYSKRRKKAFERQTIEGNRDKSPFLYKIDRMLDYCGINKNGRIIGAELFLTYVILGVLIINIILFLLSIGLFVRIAICICTVITLFIVMYMFSGVYFNKLEDNIMTLLNLIENFNKTDDDIVQIFRKSIPYVGAPLSGLLTLFCSESETIGDVNRAFDNLQARIEHKKLRQLLRNIQVCFRYETDYDQVIKDCRKSMMDYLSVKSERKAIIMNGRMEILIILACSGLIIGLFGSMTDNMAGLLFTSFIGRIILLYCFAVILICVVMMCMFDKNGD